MAVDRDDVCHVADLARLGLAESRVIALVGELNGILENMAALARIDTSGVVAGIEEGMPLRDDVVTESLAPAAIAQFAPEVQGGFFLVPRLPTHEGHGALGGAAGAAGP
ncbi:MAG: Asp-tRNA(Asn)/Glu-tRNA(Gln) amidotransferase subunit GatC [Gemmatimonadaceae bacterium]